MTSLIVNYNCAATRSLVTVGNEVLFIMWFIMYWGAAVGPRVNVAEKYHCGCRWVGSYCRATCRHGDVIALEATFNEIWAMACYDMSLHAFDTQCC